MRPESGRVSEGAFARYQRNLEELEGITLQAVFKPGVVTVYRVMDGPFDGTPFSDE